MKWIFFLEDLLHLMTLLVAFSHKQENVEDKLTHALHFNW